MNVKNFNFKILNEICIAGHFRPNSNSLDENGDLVINDGFSSTVLYHHLKYGFCRFCQFNLERHLNNKNLVYAHSLRCVSFSDKSKLKLSEYIHRIPTGEWLNEIDFYEYKKQNPWYKHGDFYPWELDIYK